jgi:hypothetical protein
VAFINASSVAPPGERNISIAVDCFVLDRVCAGATALGALFEARFPRGERELFAARFFADFAIRISVRF